jgi:hypothetical protein
MDACHLQVGPGMDQQSGLPREECVRTTPSGTHACSIPSAPPASPGAKAIFIAITAEVASSERVIVVLPFRRMHYILDQFS